MQHLLEHVTTLVQLCHNLKKVQFPDFHCFGVSGPLPSVRRPRDVICFQKAMTNIFWVSTFHSRLQALAMHNAKVVMGNLN